MVRMEVDNWHEVHSTGRLWWGAEPSKNELTRLKYPVSWVRYTYENVKKHSTDINEALQKTQRIHMEQENYNDIAYNFMIDTDGKVYEGRGWRFEAERPSAYWGLDGKCVDICYLGDFDNKDTQPTTEQFISGFYLMIFGLKEQFISPTYRNISYRDELIPTFKALPGKAEDSKV